ncbi:SDR family oxidoreductase [Fulvivirga sp.]|uniref:SDR family oxidoreductase n=1 Tax=Fulvivirga sp. TaxID=1931237 RepID=UPI0032ED3255
MFNKDLLKDKVAVITGGSGVLGSAISKALALHGAKVAIIGTNEATVVKVAEEINISGGQAIGFSANVLDKDSLIEARSEVRKKLGKCSILINAAGGNHPNGTTSKEYFEAGDKVRKDIKTFFDLDYEGISFVFNLNFLGTVLPSQVFGEDMTDTEGDRVIINVSSVSSFNPLTKVSAYSAAKASINNFTQWLAVHFSQERIRVNAIAPGFFLTKQNKTLLTEDNGELTERGRTIISQTPMHRFGNPEDLNGAVLWLCSEASTFVTGIVLPVDGGFTAFSGV